MPALQPARHPHVSHLHHSPQSAPELFDCATIAEARPLAEAFLTRVSTTCSRCARVLSQLADRVGSTLFYDDDPRALAQLFDLADRDACTLRLLAACIVCHGRARVSLSAV